MNKITELKETFCWKSKIKSVWQENPDLLDRFIARIHSEATVYDAIIRSKNRSIPTDEKIIKTIRFLEENSFWRSNPFSLISNCENDIDFLRTTSKLQKKSIRDLWEIKIIDNQKTKIIIDNQKINSIKENSFTENFPIINNNEISKKMEKVDNSILTIDSINTQKIETNSIIIENQQQNSLITSTIITNSPKKYTIINNNIGKSVGLQRNSILNDFNYEGNSFSNRTYAEAVRGASGVSGTSGMIAAHGKSMKAIVWD